MSFLDQRELGNPAPSEVSHLKVGGGGLRSAVGCGGAHDLVEDVVAKRIADGQGGGLVEPEVEPEIDPAPGVLQRGLAGKLEYERVTPGKLVRSDREVDVVRPVEIGQDREEGRAEGGVARDVARERRREVRLAWAARGPQG